MNELEKNYKYINEDEQYIKYKLLKLNKNRDLVKPFPSVYPNYMKDSRCGYIPLSEQISTVVLEKIFFIKMKTNYIKDLSVRPDLNKKPVKKNKILLKDEKEFGRYFSFENLNKNFPTKLYSINKDTLWINISNNNITFEEIVSDFEIENDLIKTQVIHCEYFQEGEEFFISHLDHEYIFYSLDEYMKRENNINQKGNIRKREKTVKIDNSKIPFIFSLKEGITEEKINILLFVLDGYFKNKELLKEYFQSIEENQ